jgi:hypothetical protein
LAVLAFNNLTEKQSLFLIVSIVSLFIFRLKNVGVFIVSIVSLKKSRGIFTPPALYLEI